MGAKIPRNGSDSVQAKVITHRSWTSNSTCLRLLIDIFSSGLGGLELTLRCHLGVKVYDREKPPLQGTERQRILDAKPVAYWHPRLSSVSTTSSHRLPLGHKTPKPSRTVSFGEIASHRSGSCAISLGPIQGQRHNILSTTQWTIINTLAR
jgi:hypothetical protein